MKVADWTASPRRCTNWPARWLEYAANWTTSPDFAHRASDSWTDRPVAATPTRGARLRATPCGIARRPATTGELLRPPSVPGVAASDRTRLRDATDGFPVPETAQITKDTFAVHPGERLDIECVADNPGKWALHCHIVHHTTNDDVEPGGLFMVVNVED